MDLSTRERSTEDVRRRLLDAALVEFADHGFDGASTRAIAERAGAHQPQINYHFDSKDELWRAVFARLLAELDELLVVPDDLPPREAMAELIRTIARFAARRPELNRIMSHEGTSDNPRLRWLVDTHLRERARDLRELWDRVAATGAAAPIPADLLYHTLLGAASLLHTVAPEARMLFDIEPTDPDVVEAHAEALVTMFLPPKG